MVALRRVAWYALIALAFAGLAALAVWRWQPAERGDVPSLDAARQVCQYVAANTGEECVEYEVSRIEQSYIVIVTNGETRRAARVIVYGGKVQDIKFLAAPGSPR